MIQATQGQFPGADICYAHFCHRAYLRDRWAIQTATGARRLLRWMGYHYNSYFEERAFRSARMVVAPSEGLVRELVETYPFLQGRAFANPNPVDVLAFAKPADFDRIGHLLSIDLNPNHPVLCFAALGDFSRKGLTLVLKAMAKVNSTPLSLLVVGGGASEIKEFKRIGDELGLGNRVSYVGFQRDVRPFFWSSDLFVFPSTYETFALVVLQAMAAGMPVVTTRLHGVEDYAVEGENAWIVERDVEEIHSAIERVLSDKISLKQAAEAATRSAKAYDTPGFVQRWSKLLKRFAK
jgi:glycosyltransferase involved in cell wall biosynthesis